MVASKANSTSAGSIASVNSTVALPLAGMTTVGLAAVSVTPALASVLLTANVPIHGWAPRLVNSMLRLAKRGSPTSSKPNDSDTRPGDSASVAITGVSMARLGFTRPAPVRVSGYGAPYSSRVCTAVFINAALTIVGVQPGCRSSSNAAAPATCGDAIDVPVICSTPLPARAE